MLVKQEVDYSNILDQKRLNIKTYKILEKDNAENTEKTRNSLTDATPGGSNNRHMISNFIDLDEMMARQFELYQKSGWYLGDQQLIASPTASFLCSKVTDNLYMPLFSNCVAGNPWLIAGFAGLGVYASCYKHLSQSSTFLICAFSSLFIIKGVFSKPLLNTIKDIYNNRTPMTLERDMNNFKCYLSEKFEELESDEIILIEFNEKNNNKYQNFHEVVQTSLLENAKSHIKIMNADKPIEYFEHNTETFYIIIICDEEKRLNLIYILKPHHLEMLGVYDEKTPASTIMKRLGLLK